MKIALIVLFLVALFSTSGFRYKIKTSLPPSTARIAIPVFVNRSFKEDLGNILTEKVVDQFMLRTNFQIVPEDEAEFVLRGRVLRYIKESTSEGASKIGEYRVRIEVEASLFKKEKRVWKEKISESEIYSLLQTDLSQTEQEAIREVCEKIGVDLVNLTLQGWKR